MLTAFNGTHVIDWLFCDREKTFTWERLIRQIPAPDIAIIDGASSLESVIRRLWPETKIQRCHFHLHHNITTNLTRNPRTQLGIELQAMVSGLSNITDLDQAAVWEATLISWMTTHRKNLNARTYAGGTNTARPTYIRAGQQWWYTHRGLRRTARLWPKLIKNKHLFTFIEHVYPG